jgi:signal transduction histidine kinase
LADNILINRLTTLPNFEGIPLKELEWLVAHGQSEIHDAGTVLAPKGKPVEYLWIILSGCVAVRVDRGAGSRLVTEWRTGEVMGMLPYSRMTGPPGDNFLDVKSELLSINIKYFPEMIHLCPLFTAYTVHLMLDRARSFNASDLQDEKMISLGKLAAGLAHELNNPASAVVRGAKMLLPDLAKVDSASRTLGAVNLTNDQINMIERVRTTCLEKNAGNMLSSLERTNRENEITDWLVGHQVGPVNAQILAETTITINDLNALAESISGDTLAASLQWIATGCAIHFLAVDIEQAATRISDLVGTVKRFTYMDNLSESEFVDVEIGLHDTIRMVASKAKSKGAAIVLDVEANLPRVQAAGSELNQVWLNLIDNALDAIPDSGQINISAHMVQDRVIICVVDNGTGIPQNSISKIFDPFFTTKPPGQGTGLGLDIARRLVRRYHGDIDVHSQPGLTEFRVSLLVE